MPSGDPARSGSIEQKRALDHRAFVAILGATFASIASVLLIFPFFASGGAEVNPYTVAILAGQILTFGLWNYATWVYARAKGYPRVDRLLPVWTLFALALLGNTLRSVPIVAPVRGWLVFSGECAVEFLILGLAGAGLTITVSILPDLRRRSLLSASGDEEVPS